MKSLKGEDQNPTASPQQQVERLIHSVSGAQTQLEGLEVATKDAYRRSHQAGDLLDVLKLPIKDATDDTKRAVASLPALEADLDRVVADRPQWDVSSAASDALVSARKVELSRISSSLSLERAIQTGGGTSQHLSSVEASLRQALASLQS